MPPDPPDQPTRKENEDPAPIARSAGSLDHYNVFALWATPITLVKVVKLSFKSDHAMMKDYDADWQSSGSVASKPEWVFGNSSKMVSHSKGQAISVDVELDIYPRNADATACSFTGTAPFGSVTFTGNVELKGGAVSFSAKSTSVTLSPDTVEKLSGDIAWKFTASNGSGSWDADKSWGHFIYATMSTPVDMTGRDRGETRKRMDKAVELVAASGSNDPHTIVSNLMGKIPGYTLITDPAVPSKYDHPKYFNSVGGAWAISDFTANAAECQAIVRWVRGLIKQVGCPGTADLVTIWADPLINNGTTTQIGENDPSLGLDSSKAVGADTWHAVLVDKYPEKGKTYDIEKRTSNYMGLNRYEACLRFNQGGTTKFYGGGAGAYSSQDEVLTAFYALVWVTIVSDSSGNRQARVQEVVRRWRDKSGNLLP